jgi:hypothetical protein
MDGLQRFTRLLAQSRASSDIIDAVRQYLDAWPAERVSRIQRIDAGWAPFDLQQHPSPPLGPADLRMIFDAVHVQCAALISAGLQLEPDLVELELFLSLACRKLGEVAPEPVAARPPAEGASRHA